MRTKRSDKMVEEDGERGRTKVAIWDVAEKAGVSIATVSRVFNDKAYVAPTTRDKVLSSARELGYESLRHPQPAPAEASGLIGLTSIFMNQVWCTEVIAGITEALHAHNARPVICPITRRHNCGMTFLERVMSGTTEGALLVGLTDTEEELVAAYASGFPFVLIEPSRSVNEKLPVVAIANWAGARGASEHLIALGHSQIGVVSLQGQGPEGLDYRAGSDRLAGFQAACMAGGLTPHADLVYPGDGTIESGRQAAHHLLGLSEPPSAIFAFNDAMAIGVMQGAQEMGISIPRELSVVGFEDSQTAQMVTPELTTVRLPYSELGRVAVDMLYRLINGQNLDVTRVELSTRLIIRESSAALHSVKQRKRSSL